MEIRRPVAICVNDPGRTSCITPTRIEEVSRRDIEAARCAENDMVEGGAEAGEALAPDEGSRWRREPSDHGVTFLSHSPPSQPSRAALFE